MKKKKIIKKQLLSILCMAVFLFIFSGCSKTTNNAQIKDQDTLTTDAESYLESWNSTDFSDYMEQYSDYLDDTTKTLYQSWQDTKDEIGEYDSIIDRLYSTGDDGTTVVTLRAKYANKTIDFSVSFNQSGEVTDTAVELYATMSEKLQKAGINTVMSIAIVFVVLIFISFIIYLLKYIPELLGLEKKEAAPVVETAPAIPVAEEENLTDDTELVAVITAAIMASMGSEAPADGLVISSIKRRTSNKWKRR